ncbi:hypothetical protein, partial [Microvirga tunisiensis]|uniref:hypothetical protein n=1 Tax=Microvirga tunisiensis TaxID=2108360 RepID=UPI001AEE2084
AFARQMRLHPIPLVIFQHQTNSAHPSLRAQKELESDLRVRRKPECQRALVSYEKFPPLQAPESYNLSEILEQVKKANASHGSE